MRYIRSVMNVRFSAHTLHFRHPFRIAHGIRSTTPVVIVELEHEGLTGYGEASMPPYLGESHETVMAFLQKAKPFLETQSDPSAIDAILGEVDALAPLNTAAKASIDIALHDLNGKLLQRPCWQLFGADKANTPRSTYTLGIDTPEMLKQKLEEGAAFPVLKVKLNGEDDCSVIGAIRSWSDKPIAVDVNQGWKTKEEALRMIEWLADKQVLFVEQPLDKDDPDAAHWLYERSPLPLYADESIQRYADVERMQGCFHGINIKLMKCTGLREAQRMIRRARALNLKLLIGCMSETSCAVSAAAQLTPFADHADLDGPMLISDDLFRGITFMNGKIMLKDEPGIGVLRL